MSTNDPMTEAAVRLPAAFLEAIAEHGEKALGDWLRLNAPANVASFFDNWLAVKIAADCTRAGKVHGIDASLLEYVANVASGVTELGGAWHGPTGAILTKTAAPVAVAGD